MRQNAATLPATATHCITSSASSSIHAAPPPWGPRPSLCVTPAIVIVPIVAPLMGQAPNPFFPISLSTRTVLALTPGMNTLASFTTSISERPVPCSELGARPSLLDAAVLQTCPYPPISVSNTCILAASPYLEGVRLHSFNLDILRALVGRFLVDRPRRGIAPHDE
ncbi:hypothetical protein HYPSUDRAFT_205058 [Hypholoma sublateritium FD-334 SS-4]|uniref:Uncharacterized protein n=1 Tax=Hypholoma sublateritium (strain FD-334 SS-4) TaxID=945553 RepID=A0A0D2NIY2_HYPSF|nr:hypothetical protein HYPSUDRAFT_205058 [Hypholoma sublateritium FD-334 SS-4]